MRSRGIRYSACSVLWREGVELKTLFDFAAVDLRMQEFRSAQVIPGTDGRQRAVIGHVALQRSDGNVTLLDGSIIGAVLGVRSEVLFTDPEVRLAARIDMFGNHGASILNSLPRYLDAFDLSLRNIHV